LKLNAHLYLLSRLEKSGPQPVTLIYFLDVVELKLFDYGELLNISDESIFLGNVKNLAYLNALLHVVQ